MAGINFAGEYNIQELKLFTSAGNVIDLSGSYMTMNIYEDIFSPCMTGDITVVDTNAILMNAPVTGQDFLSFKITWTVRITFHTTSHLHWRIHT